MYCARFLSYNTHIFEGRQRLGPSRGRRGGVRYFKIHSRDIVQPIDPSLKVSFSQPNPFLRQQEVNQLEFYRTTHKKKKTDIFNKQLGKKREIQTPSKDHHLHSLRTLLVKFEADAATRNKSKEKEQLYSVRRLCLTFNNNELISASSNKRGLRGV